MKAPPDAGKFPRLRGAYLAFLFRKTGNSRFLQNQLE